MLFFSCQCVLSCRLVKHHIRAAHWKSTILLQVGIPPRELLFPVYADGQLQLVPAAGDSWLARIAALRAAYLQVLPLLHASVASSYLLMLLVFWECWRKSCNIKSDGKGVRTCGDDDILKARNTMMAKF